MFKQISIIVFNTKQKKPQHSSVLFTKNTPKVLKSWTNSNLQSCSAVQTLEITLKIVIYTTKLGTWRLCKKENGFLWPKWQKLFPTFCSLRQQIIHSIFVTNFDVIEKDRWKVKTIIFESLSVLLTCHCAIKNRSSFNRRSHPLTEFWYEIVLLTSYTFQQQTKS